MRARPDINAAFHTHIPACVAVANQECGLLPVSQSSMRFWDDVGYHDYQGITEDLGEREAIARNLGDRNVLLMRHHGVVTVGKSARDAFLRMREIEAACDLQLRPQDRKRVASGKSGSVGVDRGGSRIR